jgi:hypothetical protein
MNKGMVSMAEFKFEEMLQIREMLKDGDMVGYPVEDTLIYSLSRELLSLYRRHNETEAALTQANTDVVIQTNCLERIKQETEIILKALHDAKGE